MTTITTELKPPPEWRGGKAEAYVDRLYKWALLYHSTLEPLVRAAAQLKQDIDDLGELTQTITNPPTQSEVEAIQTKLNAIIAAASD